MTDNYPTQRYLAQRPDGHTLDGIPGDCYRACLAIILDVDVDQVPHVVMHGDSWWHLTRRTVRELRPGYDITCLLPTPWPVWSDPAAITEAQRLVVATGRSPRGPFQHCVVIDSLTGEQIWDPHPSRDGLVGDITEIDALVPTYDPPPDPPTALPPAPPRTAIEHVARLQAAGHLQLCRQTKPLTEGDAQALVEFTELLGRREATQ